MKNFNFLSRLAGLTLAGLTSIVGWGQPMPNVQRTPMTTNYSAGAPVNGDVPTYDLATHKWTFAAPPGASGGEANTGANDGAGMGLYASKVGITLHFNTLTNNSYLTISSNASLLTLSVVGLQPTNNNLTLLSAFGPNTWQATNANLTLLQAFGPTTWQATNSNLTLLQAFGPTTWQATNAVLTLLTSLTDPGADRLVMWDDTDNAFVNATVGANLTYTHASHTLSASGGSGATNIDYGSANTYTITNALYVLGTMSISNLNVNSIIVTNNSQASNVTAVVGLFGASGKVTNTLNAGAVTVNDDPYDATGWNGSTNVPTKNAVRDKIETLAASSQTPWSSDINGAGYSLTNVAAISGGGAGTSWVFNASVDIHTNLTADRVISTNQLYTYGNVEASQYMIVGAAYSYRFTGRGRLQSPSDGVLRASYDDSTTLGTFQGNVDAVTATVGTATFTNSPTYPLTSTWTAHSSGSNYVVDVSIPRLHFAMTTNVNIIHATNGTANFTANTAKECGIKIINSSGTNFPVSFPSDWKCYGNAVSNHICWLTNGDWLTIAVQFSGPSTSQTNIDAAVAYRSPGT